MRDNFNHSCSVSYLTGYRTEECKRVCANLKRTWWHENLDQLSSFYDWPESSNIGYFKCGAKIASWNCYQSFSGSNSLTFSSYLISRRISWFIWRICWLWLSCCIRQFPFPRYDRIWLARSLGAVKGLSKQNDSLSLKSASFWHFFLVVFIIPNEFIHKDIYWASVLNVLDELIWLHTTQVHLSKIVLNHK